MCVDARRGEVFAAGPRIAPCVAAPEALAARLAAGALIVGDGAVRHRDCFVQQAAGIAAEVGRLTGLVGLDRGIC